MTRPYNKVNGEFKAPTEFLIAAEVRRLEKQDACGHTELYADAAGFLTECANCGKSFNDDEMDEIEWALEDSAGEISAQ